MNASEVFRLLRMAEWACAKARWSGEDYGLAHEIRSFASAVEAGEFREAREWISNLEPPDAGKEGAA